MPISSLLNISKDAIAIQQIAMNVTGANIANVNTPGYTRQRVDINSLSSVEVVSGKTDFGIEVSGIERLYDRYLELQIVDQSQSVAYSEVRKDILGQVESIFNDSVGGGLNDVMSQFWNAWEYVSTSPGSTVARDSLVSSGENLASLFHEYSAALGTIRQNVQSGMEDTVHTINSITEEIAQLNEKTMALGSEGNANNLLDKRTELLKSLSSTVNISFYENSDGTLSTFLSNGLPLVEGTIAKKLQVTTGGDIVFQSDPSTILNDEITGGKLGGLIEIRDHTIQGYIDQLNLLAVGIANALNGQHQTGFDVYGNAGGTFFAPTTGASDLQVQMTIAADSKLVASSSLDSAVNGENARQIANLKNSLIMGMSSATFGDYYASLVGQIGYDVTAVMGSFGHDTQVMDQLNAQREAVSGVSLDEEMINLMKYQYAYNAAGRLAKVASDMLDVLMNLGQ